MLPGYRQDVPFKERWQSSLKSLEVSCTYQVLGGGKNHPIEETVSQNWFFPKVRDEHMKNI